MLYTILYPRPYLSTSITTSLPSMLHNLTNQLSPPHYMLHLLRHRPLHIIILLPLPRQNNINARTQTRKDLSAQTLLAQHDRRAVHLIEHYRRQHAEHLQLEFRALDDIDGRDEGVDHERSREAVIDGDGVALARDADGGFGAAADEDGVVDRGCDLDDFRGRVEVFDDPFVAVEGFARRLFGSHALRFGLFAGERRFTACGGLGRMSGRGRRGRRRRRGGRGFCAFG